RPLFATTLPGRYFFTQTELQDNTINDIWVCGMRLLSATLNANRNGLLGTACLIQTHTRSGGSFDQVLLGVNRDDHFVRQDEVFCSGGPDPTGWLTKRSSRRLRGNAGGF